MTLRSQVQILSPKLVFPVAKLEDPKGYNKGRCLITSAFFLISTHICGLLSAGQQLINILFSHQLVATEVEMGNCQRVSAVLNSAKRLSVRFFLMTRFHGSENLWH